MACKIQIKENIASSVREETTEALNQPLSVAEATGNRVNSEFGDDVVSFTEKNGQVNRDIHIPSELVDVYYNQELQTDYLKKPPTRSLEDLEQELRDGFLSDFGITAEEYNDLKEDLGVDAYTASDLVSKAIAYKKGESILPEVAYFAYTMLGKNNNKIRGELRYLVHNWEKYGERFRFHSKTIQQNEGYIKDPKEWKTTIRDRVIADFLKEHILEYYNNPTEFKKSLDTKWVMGIDKFSQDFTMWENIVKWFEEVLDKFSGKYKDKQAKLNDLGLAIADEVINRNYQYFNYELGEEQIKKEYESTINTDKFAKSLVEFGQKIGLVLTGSLAIRKAGSLYRTAKESIHDIDWVIPYKLNSNQDNVSTLEKITAIQAKYIETVKNDRPTQNELKELQVELTQATVAEVKNLSWYKSWMEKYPNFEQTGGFYGGKGGDLSIITVQGVIDPKRYDSLGFHEEYYTKITKDPLTKEPISEKVAVKVAHKKGDIIKDTGHVIDFFVSLADNQLEEHDNFFHHWKEVMIAKLGMGRDKDFIDWKAFVPYMKDNTNNFKYKGFRNLTYESSVPDQAILANETPATQLYQTKESTSSKATNETVALVKQAAEKMGIKMLELQDYLKGNPDVRVGGVNGLADLTQKTIAVAKGMEGYALTEEVVHVATAILEQTDPKLITQLISKIDKFKIYKKTLDEYKNLKGYQLPNGKPDIRKIKKEAVDKLIAEVIVYESEGSTEFPELREESTLKEVKSWWETIMDYIRNLYSKSNISVFQEAAKKITEGNIGSVEDINSEGIYLQQRVENAQVNAFYDQIQNHHKELQLNPESVNDKRHYMYKGTERVQSSVTEKVKKGSIFSNDDKTPVEIKVSEDMMNWGDKGHKFVEKDITTNLIDENGYAIPDKKQGISSDFTFEQTQVMKQFSRKLISSYPPGTRFVIEKRVINTKVKGYLASTVDFVAIVPDAETGFKIDTLDWKFSNIDKEKTEDVPWYSQGDWKKQMSEYIKIWSQYGAKPNQIRKARMVPFIAGYVDVDAMNPLKGKRLASLEVGDLNDVKKTELHMLPVPIDAESTDNPKVDALLGKLRAEYDKIFEKHVAGETKASAILRRDKLARAIRSLHLQMNFEPLVNIGKDFIDTAGREIKEIKKIDFFTASTEVIQLNMASIQEMKRGVQKYINLDDVYLSQFDKRELEKDAFETYVGLKKIADRSNDMMKSITELEQQYTIYLADRENIVSRDSDNSILTAELPVAWMNKTFNEASKLPIKILNTFVKIVLNSNSAANMRVASKIDSFAKLLEPLEKEAKRQGKKAFDLIAKVKDGKMQLIHKFDDKFWADIKEAKRNKNKEYLKTLIDQKKYKELVDKYVDEGIQEIISSTVANDPKEAEKIKNREIKRLVDSVDMYSETFSGFKRAQFSYILNQSIDEERHYSAEFKALKANAPAYKMWEFFTDLNKRAKDMGYLGKQGMSFFPLIEATIIQKFNTGSFFDESKDFFKDLYLTTEDENQLYSKIDPETGQPKKQIPAFFTTSKKDVSKLSTDLNKVATLWIESLEKYETTKDLEITKEALLSVERAKGSAVLEPDGSVRVLPSGLVDPNLAENKNADILEAYADDILYKLQEDVNSLGNIKLQQAAGKMFKDEDTRQNFVVGTKKVLNNANTLVRALAIGLKVPIGIANWFGYNFQAFINAGEMYSWADFNKNRNKLMVSATMSTKDKALLHHFIPLTESVSEMKRRQIALKQNGITNWLSTFSFTDIMMSTNSYPEKLLDLSNAQSFIDNTMIRDGKLVNIRQQLKRDDAKKKYERDASGVLVLSKGDFRVLESTFDSRLKALKEKESLIHHVEMNDEGEITIPGVSLEEQAKFRVQMIEFGRRLSGQMNSDNKAGFRRDTTMSSFMMFKGWIPKQLIVRHTGLRYDAELDSWDYGRSRAFAKTWIRIGLFNIKGLNDIIMGNEDGLRVLEEMLQQKKEDHLRKTGEHLEITNEEFYDLMRSQITNQFKELGVLVGLLGLVLAAKAAEPPEEASILEKNRYKTWAKIVNKIADELSFYYSPASADSIMKGNFIPALGLLKKVGQVAYHLEEETRGHIVDDEEITKDAHPGKYIMNLIPIGSQFMNEYLPIIAPDMAKEWGYRVTSEARRQ